MIGFGFGLFKSFDLSRNYPNKYSNETRNVEPTPIHWEGGVRVSDLRDNQNPRVYSGSIKCKWALPSQFTRKPRATPPLNSLPNAKSKVESKETKKK